MAAAAAAAAAAAVEVDIAVWRAIAGESVEIPRLEDSVFYFPQGHLEHNSIDPSAPNCCSGIARPHFICRVKSIRLLSHPSTDEVFAVFLLQPEEGPRRRLVTGTGETEDRGTSNLVALAKVLTQSDANNGGGFSVPRSCAESIFPRLNFEGDPPVQKLIMKDTHNKLWEFRHIYRGTPRRHLLTTGWGNYVNAKRLIAGDSVVFMKKTSTNELLLGVRRVRRLGRNNDFVCGGESFGSYTREPMEAVENAANGRAFEVAYYPRIGWPDFLVSVDKVMNAMSRSWGAGMRIKMAVEADNSSQLTWFRGMVTAVTMPDSGQWCGSLWRMLKVNWAEPAPPFRNMERVSPWNVEYDLSVLGSHLELPPPKKIRPKAGDMILPLFNLPPFPAGMQGGRQDAIWIPLPEYQFVNVDQALTQQLKNDMESEPGTVSTLVRIGSPISGNFSPYLDGVRYISKDLSNHKEHSSQVPGDTSSSFQLFGSVIPMSKSDESSLENNVSDTNGKGKEVCNNGNHTNSPPRSPILLG